MCTSRPLVANAYKHLRMLGISGPGITGIAFRSPKWDFSWKQWKYHFLVRIVKSQQKCETDAWMVRGCAWTLLNMHEYAWICMDLHESAWICMDMHGNAWICMNGPCLWISLEQKALSYYTRTKPPGRVGCKYAWICMDLHGFASMCMNMHGYACKRTGIIPFGPWDPAHMGRSLHFSQQSLTLHEKCRF